MIQVEHLSKSFGPVHAVRDISFTAPDGAITGILGKNGAGKTTTLGVICGLVRADGGSIRVGPGDSTAIERRRRLGALLDHKGLYERLTARENIAYFGRLQGIPRGALDARVQDVLTQLGLDRVADRRTVGFSQGERMKVALGRALVHGRRTCCSTSRPMVSTFRASTGFARCCAACGHAARASSFRAT